MSETSAAAGRNSSSNSSTLCFTGRYRFSPLRRIQIDGECVELWAALDALVLKALELILNRRLDFPRSCYHVPGKDE